ncbi:MAG: isoprenyl transferase [Pseudomonadota bacterium]
MLKQNPDTAESIKGGKNIPRHIAIIMDGNGRWAKNRNLPRTAGHQAGVAAVQRTVEYCARKGVEVLTLFAFSSENWRRPPQEVSVLMELFVATLQRETKKLNKNGIQLQFIGDKAALSGKLQKKIAEAEALTKHNDTMVLNIAANYGGRWDIVQAMRQIAGRIAAGELAVSEVDANLLDSYLSTGGLPEPDLFIRTGGEKRISNFLLWQIAYTELYFTPTLWPDFDEKSLDQALGDFMGRQRRFGQTGDQLETSVGSIQTTS